nr:hypothetical protein [Tanacetum cinerariifolium]
LTWLFVLPWSVLLRLLDWGLATGNGDSSPYPLHLGGLALFTFGSTFDEALCVFNNGMEIDLLSNLSKEVDIWLDGGSNQKLRLPDMLLCSWDRGKEVDIWLDGGSNQKLRLPDMLLCSWDRGLDICVDLTGSSHLTQTGMTDFATGRTVSDAAHRKRSKYMDKCAAIRYVFLPFSFSLGELEADVVTLLKRIQKFSMA